MTHKNMDHLADSDRDYFYKEFNKLNSEVAEIRATSDRTAADVANIFSMLRQMQASNRWDAGTLMVMLVIVTMASTLIWTLIGNEAEKRIAMNTNLTAQIRINREHHNDMEEYVSQQAYDNGQRDADIDWLKTIAMDYLLGHKGSNHPQPVIDMQNEKFNSLRERIQLLEGEQ